MKNQEIKEKSNPSINCIMQQEKSLFVLWGPSRVSIGRHLPRILKIPILSLDFRKQKKWVLKRFVEFLYDEPPLNKVSFFFEILQIWGRNQNWQWSGDWWIFVWWNNFIHFKSLSAQTSASYHFERGGVQLFWKFGKKNPRNSQLPSNCCRIFLFQNDTIFALKFVKDQGRWKHFKSGCSVNC
jgi:hypothetical protein